MTKSCYYVFSENEYKKIIAPTKYQIFTNNLVLAHKYKNICLLGDFIEKKCILTENIKFRYKYRKILNEFDKQVSKIKKKNLSIFISTAHSTKRIFSYIINFLVFINCLKKKKIKIIYFFYHKDLCKNDYFSEYEIYLSILLRLSSLKNVGIKIKKKEFNQYENKYLGDNYLSSELKFSLSFKLKIFYKILNFISILLSNKKTKYLGLVGFNFKKGLLFYFKLFHCRPVFLDTAIKIKNNKILEKKTFTAIIKKEILYLISKINLDKKISYNILIDFYFYIYEQNYNKFSNLENSIYNDSFYKNIKGALINVESPTINFLALLLSKLNIKTLTLSHGGTVGHYYNYPPVTFYDLQLKKGYYQVFSKKLKNNLIKSFFISKIVKKNLLVVPSLDLINLKKKKIFITNSSQYKNYNICYVASPNHNVIDLKRNNQSNVELQRLRSATLNFFSKQDKFNIFIKTYRDEKFLFHSKKLKTKKIKYIRKNKFSDLNENIDLYIFETMSTALLEASTLNKTIFCLNRNMQIESNVKNILSKTVYLFNDSNDLLKKLKKFFSKKINIKKNNKNLALVLYDFNNISLNTYFNKIKHFFYV